MDKQLAELFIELIEDTAALVERKHLHDYHDIADPMSVSKRLSDNVDNVRREILEKVKQ